MAYTEKTLFQEEQQFRQYWLWAMLVGSFLFSVGLIIMVLRGDEADKNELYISLGILLPVFAIIFYLMYISKLETKVTPSGIFYRWHPIFRKYSFIASEEIDRAEVRKAPFGQYGYHLFPSYGQVHNVKGREGVQLYLKNGKKIFFGTQDIFLFKKSIDQIIARHPKH